MNDAAGDATTPLALHARPDGEAELPLVLRLRWEDVAALGRDAGRLAARLRRPVTLDEAVSHRLRGSASFAPAALDGSHGPAGSQTTALDERPAGAQAGEAPSEGPGGAGAAAPPTAPTGHVSGGRVVREQLESARPGAR
ncbi:hypothetical protein NPS70_01865 [Streptomyces sp. C10-9-1]|uniref:hypothetical protein n=1 Tax=Streptomyces sp. C10-9-1 TaxID=1859285 RepID=UPI002112FF7A|nr:hypothetical protein [Streptomyces sp. C10-9-1]MCQ6551954.1 hypothetical protein [Streptomyces sp. C10-9-1]